MSTILSIVGISMMALGAGIYISAQRGIARCDRTLAAVDALVKASGLPEQEALDKTIDELRQIVRSRKVTL